MSEAAAPEVVVVDGASIAATSPGRVSLARLESALGALRAALPQAECIVFVDAALQGQLSEPEAIRLDVLVERGLFRLVSPDSKTSAGKVLLAAAEAAKAAVLSNDTFHKERDGFPWLLDDDRLIGHSYGGGGWWVFMTRTRSTRWSWTGHDAEGPAIESLHDVRDAAADTPPDPQSYEELIRSASHGVAIVPHAVIRDAVAILFESETARPREDLVADVVGRDLGLTVYGAAALLYRFEGAGIVREVEAGRLERSPDLTEDEAIDRVVEDVLEEVLALGDSALGHRDRAAARRALGLPAKRKAAAAAKAPAKKKKTTTKAAATPAKKPAPAKRAGRGAERPRVRTGPAGTEWVVRCGACGVEIVGPDRATATSRLAAHAC
jgi:hypothetical protein